MTGFNDITTSDHCGFFLDLSRDIILKGKTTQIPSPFERQLKSNSPKSVRKYKHYLKQQTNKYNIESQIENILKKSKQRKLTKEEEVNLNRIDKRITKIMLRVEKKITNQHHNYPWIPLEQSPFGNLSYLSLKLSCRLKSKSTFIYHPYHLQLAQKGQTSPTSNIN